MQEYRFLAKDDELDDFEEESSIDVDDDMGDYGMDEDDEEELIVTSVTSGILVPVVPVGPAPSDSESSKPPTPAKKPVKKASAPAPKKAAPPPAPAAKSAPAATSKPAAKKAP